jgi:hypothetical protein
MRSRHMFPGLPSEDELHCSAADTEQRGELSFRPHVWVQIANRGRVLFVQLGIAIFGAVEDRKAAFRHRVQGVFSLCAQKQMPLIATGRIVACVKDFLSFGDGPMRQFPSEAVRHLAVFLLAGWRKTTVSMGAFFSQIWPALGGFPHKNPHPEQTQPVFGTHMCGDFA